MGLKIFTAQVHIYIYIHPIWVGVLTPSRKPLRFGTGYWISRNWPYLLYNCSNSSFDPHFNMGFFLSGVRSNSFLLHLVTELVSVQVDESPNKSLTFSYALLFSTSGLSIIMKTSAPKFVYLTTPINQRDSLSILCIVENIVQYCWSIYTYSYPCIYIYIHIAT